jgi:hypothetical protein
MSMGDTTSAARSTTPRLLPPIFPLLAAAGLLVAFLLYRQTFREATIDLTVGRAAAEERALAFLTSQSVAAGARWRSASFQTDTSAQDYLIASRSRISSWRAGTSGFSRRSIPRSGAWMCRVAPAAS